MVLWFMRTVKEEPVNVTSLEVLLLLFLNICAHAFCCFGTGWESFFLFVYRLEKIVLQDDRRCVCIVITFRREGKSNYFYCNALQYM